jgi:hypothetical protein
MYADPDKENVFFAGHGAAASARATFENAKAAWTCILFREVDATGFVPVPSPEPPREEPRE